MLMFGIDVLILGLVGMLLVACSYIAARLIPLSQDAGVAAVVATLVASVTMLVTYVVMAEVLDVVTGL